MVRYQFSEYYLLLFRNFDVSVLLKMISLITLPVHVIYRRYGFK
jgi:hypothetical protein